MKRKRPEVRRQMRAKRFELLALEKPGPHVVLAEPWDVWLVQ
jgi:hypothetical protein